MSYYPGNIFEEDFETIIQKENDRDEQTRLSVREWFAIAEDEEDE